MPFYVFVLLHQSSNLFYATLVTVPFGGKPESFRTARTQSKKHYLVPKGANSGSLGYLSGLVVVNRLSSFESLV